MTTPTPLSIQQRFPDVAFGTSGVRALVTALNADVIDAYVQAFMQRMRAAQGVAQGSRVAVGMDLRPSSPAIAATVCKALAAAGHEATFLGALPTPALALHCLTARIPGIMVTGSHIPFDRNGIKFYSPYGEILKNDERAIMASEVAPTASLPLMDEAALKTEDPSARTTYLRRYVDRFGPSALAGLRIGIYQHSAVGRDLTQSLLQHLGAEVVALGRSEGFVPVDTEAVGEADLAQARAWCHTHGLHALVSTDGDGDRPLVFDEKGEFVRGDLLGLLCARSLGIQTLAVPVSCNTAIEQSGAFKRVVRTRIGSPFVIEAMQSLAAGQTGAVAGFEANGGFLLGTRVGALQALPTRDAMLPVCVLLADVAARQSSVSAWVATLPDRHTHSDRLQAFATERSRALLSRLVTDRPLQQQLAGKASAPHSVDTTDGVRMTFADGDIVHLRASGNAPELRCYAESASLEQAKALCQAALRRVEQIPA